VVAVDGAGRAHTQARLTQSAHQPSAPERTLFADGAFRSRFLLV
jgi:hypothetical protein